MQKALSQVMERQEPFAKHIAEQKKMLADTCGDMSDEISSQLYTFGQMRNLYEEQMKEQGSFCGAQLDETIEDLEKFNEELAVSLAQLQQAYEQTSLTQEELNKAYLEIENARQE